MITISYLSDLMPGQTAYVYDISKTDIRRRLCELGFVAGTKVKCVAASSLGGPLAYLVRGTLIALRRSDADCIRVQVSPELAWD